MQDSSKPVSRQKKVPTFGGGGGKSTNDLLINLASRASVDGATQLVSSVDEDQSNLSSKNNRNLVISSGRNIVSTALGDHPKWITSSPGRKTTVMK